MVTDAAAIEAANQKAALEAEVASLKEDARLAAIHQTELRARQAEG